MWLQESLVIPLLLHPPHTYVLPALFRIIPSNVGKFSKVFKVFSIWNIEIQIDITYMILFSHLSDVISKTCEPSQQAHAVNLSRQLQNVDQYGNVGASETLIIDRELSSTFPFLVTVEWENVPKYQPPMKKRGVSLSLGDIIILDRLIALAEESRLLSVSQMHSFWVLVEIILTFSVATSSSNNDNDATTYIPPNLYFIGVSKGGTSSMIHIINQHPLIVGVGNSGSGGAAGESHIMARNSIESIDAIKKVEAQRLQIHLQKKNATAVLSHGVIVHYTPHYIIDPTIGDKILQISKSENRTPKNLKLLVMLREPTSRTISSWWYKSGCYKHDCKPLHTYMAEGMKKVNDLDDCMTRLGGGISKQSTLFTTHNGKVTDDMNAVLSKCYLKLLKPENTSLYDCHFGKSAYAQQLIRWYTRFHHSQIYVLVLENFEKDPIGQMELLFTWLGVPTYGPEGFASKESLFHVTQKKHNVRTIPREVYARDVAPYKVYYCYDHSGIVC